MVDMLLEMYCHIKEKVFPRKMSIAGKNSPFSLSVRSWFRAGSELVWLQFPGNKTVCKKIISESISRDGRGWERMGEDGLDAGNGSDKETCLCLSSLHLFINHSELRMTFKITL